jgi:hypothetical protein
MSVLRITPPLQLQAALLKARDSAPRGLHFKETNCDGYLEHRACQLQRLVLRQVAMRIARALPSDTGSGP